MANVIIKSDERRAYESRVLNDFGGNGTTEHREYAECIAARTQEALAEMRRKEKC